MLSLIQIRRLLIYRLLASKYNVYGRIEGNAYAGYNIEIRILVLKHIPYATQIHNNNIIANSNILYDILDIQSISKVLNENFKVK